VSGGRIFISAYEYHPQGVSEAWAAYQLVAALRRRGRRLVVATRATPNKPQWPGVLRVRCALPKKPLLWGPNYVEYLLRMQRLASRVGDRIALTQHAAPVSLRAPNTLGALKVPFIWGPVGGCIPFPPGFESYSRGSGWMNNLRGLDRARLRFDPSLTYTMRTAERIVVTASMAAELIPDAYRHKISVIPDGMPDEVLLERPEPEGDYIFSSGRLLPYKALDLLLRAHARLQGSSAVRLIVTGDGPMRAQLVALAESLGTSNRVEFLGRVPRAQNHALMSRALFCVYPSLKEAFGHVNLEAMAAWKPVVATDWAGPRDLIVDGVTGLKVLGRGPAEHVELLSGAMSRLLVDSRLRLAMGVAAARRLAEEYLWNGRVADRYERLYGELGV
jgi:glycosyltransferase involved in cell wall biosynthesis